MLAKSKLTANPERQIDSFLAKYDPAIAAFARRVLVRMRKRLLGAVEMVYDNYNGLVIGFGPNDRASLAIFSIVLFPRWVTLCFLQGAGLPDPQRRLQGEGRVVRHIRLEDFSEAGELGSAPCESAPRSQESPAAYHQIHLRQAATPQTPPKTVVGTKLATVFSQLCGRRRARRACSALLNSISLCIHARRVIGYRHLFLCFSIRRSSSMHFHQLNWLAILVAAISAMVVGFLWYSPVLFAKPWMREMGYDPNDKAKVQEMQKSAGPAYAGSFLASLVSAFMLAKLRSVIPIDSALYGMKLGLGFCIGSAATVQLTAALFMKNSMKLFAINTGYQLVCYLLLGAILAVWK